MGISKYVIIIVSLTIFFIPVSQVDAIFSTSLEISDEEFFENYKEIQKFKMEKFRDYYFEKYLRIQNPYNDKISENVIIFNDQKFNMPLSIDRHDENFQMLKTEQIYLAQKKYLEIMGGKTITSSLGDKPDKRIIPILEFTDEEESIRKVIHRDDEGFKSYKALFFFESWRGLDVFNNPNALNHLVCPRLFLIIAKLEHKYDQK